jgi:hypothetical protein
LQIVFLVNLPDYKAGHQHNISIDDNPICIPLFGKVEDPYREGAGEIF